jgi:hypothetical protein
VFISFEWPKAPTGHSKTEPKKRPPESLAALCAVPCAPRYFARELNSLTAFTQTPLAFPQNSCGAQRGMTGLNGVVDSKKVEFRMMGFAFDLCPFDAAEHRAFIGLSKNLFERSEFIFAPMKARSAGNPCSGQIVGCAFFWFCFCYALRMLCTSKENEHAASAKK